MAIKTEYKDPGGELPMLTCPCGSKEFLQHEREPGKRMILECMSCRALSGVGVKAYLSAYRSFTEDTEGQFTVHMPTDENWAEFNR